MPIAPATSSSFSADLDRRSGARRPLRVAATLTFSAGQVMHARTVDVGLHALSIMVEQNLPAKAELKVALSLPVKGEARPLNLRARVEGAILTGGGFRIDLALHDMAHSDIDALEEYVVR